MTPLVQVRLTSGLSASRWTTADLRSFLRDSSPVAGVVGLKWSSLELILAGTLHQELLAI